MIHDYLITYFTVNIYIYLSLSHLCSLIPNWTLGLALRDSLSTRKEKKQKAEAGKSSKKKAESNDSWRAAAKTTYNHDGIWQYNALTQWQLVSSPSRLQVSKSDQDLAEKNDGLFAAGASG